MPLTSGIESPEKVKQFWKFKRVGSRVAVGAATAAAAMVASTVVTDMFLFNIPGFIALGAFGFAVGRNLMANKQKKDLDMKRHKIFGRTKGENIQTALVVAGAAIPMIASQFSTPGILLGAAVGIATKITVGKIRKMIANKKAKANGQSTNNPSRSPIPRPIQHPEGSPLPGTEQDFEEDTEDLDDDLEEDGPRHTR